MTEIQNTPDEFPICPDCGERHPAIDDNPFMVYVTALADAVKEAQKVVDDAEPGQYPTLEVAIMRAMLAGMKVLMMGGAPEAPAPEKVAPVEVPDDGYGLYL